MYISQEDLANLKYAQEYQKGNIKINSGATVPPPLPSFISSDVIDDFYKLNKREVDFHSERDLNQLSYFNAFNTLKFKSNNLDFLLKSDSNDLKNLFGVFSKYSQGFESKLFSATLEFEVIPGSELIRKIYNWLESDKYITEKVINALAKRNDASDMLLYVHQTVPKDFFSEDGLESIEKNLFFLQDKKQNNLEIALKRLDIKIDNNFKDIKNSQVQQPSNTKSPEQLQEEKNTQIFLNSLNTLGNEITKIGQKTDNQDLIKIGSAIGSAAAIATGAVGYSAATGLAAAGPAGVMIVGAIGIISLFSSGKGSGKALVQIHQAIINMHTEMREQFHLVHKEIAQTYELIYTLAQYTAEKLELLHNLQYFTIGELSELIKTDLFSDISRIINDIESKHLPRDATSLENDLAQLDSFASKISVESSLNGANLRYDSLHNENTQNQLTLRKSVIDNIGFYVDYAANNLNISDLPNGNKVPNFNLFYKMLEAFISLTLQALDHDATTTNSEDKLIDKKNAKYIADSLERFFQINKLISNIAEAFESKNIIGKVLNQYESLLEHTSDHITKEMQKYSDSTGKDGIKGDFSIFKPSYETINKCKRDVEPSDYSGYHRVHEKYYVKDKIHFSGGEILVRILECRSYKCHGHNNNVATWYGSTTCQPNTETKASVNAKLGEYRSNFLNSDPVKNHFSEAVKKLNDLEQLAKAYIKILGGNISSDSSFTSSINTLYSSNWQQISAENPMSELKDYALVTDKLSKMKEAYNNVTSGANYFREVAQVYGLKLNTTKNILNLFLAESNSGKTINIDKKISRFAQEIEKIKEDIAENLSSKPAKLDKFNSLLEKLLDSTQDKDDVEQLNNKYCDLFCLDRHLKISSDVYRYVMKDDSSMADFAGEIKILNDGEMNICQC